MQEGCCKCKFEIMRCAQMIIAGFNVKLNIVYKGSI